MKVLSYILIGSVKFYKFFISPIIPNSCRYTPTCSSYAIEAIQKHGPLKGGWLALKRILRCNPFFHGGIDLP